MHKYWGLQHHLPKRVAQSKASLAKIVVGVVISMVCAWEMAWAEDGVGSQSVDSK
jgi:hypothetical protein